MTFLNLHIDNRQNVHAVDIAALHQRLTAVISAERSASADVTVVLVDDAEIHRLNRTFLGHDWPTDVVTFPAEDAGYSGDCAALRGQGRFIAGELAVSVDAAVREAAAHGWRLADELLLYCVHGWLHLCGYDDLSDAERPQMRRRERELLALFGLSPTELES